MRIVDTHDSQALIPSPDTRRKVAETLGAIYKLLKERRNGNDKIIKNIDSIRPSEAEPFQLEMKLEREPWQGHDTLMIQGEGTTIKFTIVSGGMIESLQKQIPDYGFLERCECRDPAFTLEALLERLNA